MILFEILTPSGPVEGITLTKHLDITHIVMNIAGAPVKIINSLYIYSICIQYSKKT